MQNAFAARLESLAADAVFGGRLLRKRKIASASAILSLALGFGASIAAFRLIDSLFLRPLPVAHPEQLYVLTFQDLFERQIGTRDQFEYPAFRLLRASANDQADLLAIAFATRTDLTFGSEQETERAWRQYVSGSMFREFGLKPALGRLLTEQDDVTPGADPYAVISWDYWSRRFGKDPGVIGRHFRMGNDSFEIIGVAPQGFTGTDRGTFTDIFLPNMMNVSALNGPYNGYRIYVIPKAGARLSILRDRLSAALHAYHAEEVKSWPAVRLKQERDFFVAAPVSLEPAATPRSGTQRGYRQALMILAVLVGLVLLIACANVANLMTAQAAARAREMALRISIGAGRARLMQLVLMESALIAAAASALGLAFSWWAAPFVVSKLGLPDQPVRLDLIADWRVTIFAVGLAFAVTALCGLAPALRASSISPASALKGSSSLPRARRLMHGLTAAQAAFCTFVLFVAGLFIATFEKMANQPTGFSAARVLTLECEISAALPSESLRQAVEQLRSVPGVESAALSQYALMSFNAQTAYVWANGHSPAGTWSNSTWILGISPGWFETMKMPLLAGRDFRWNDEFPKVAVVNEKFAHRYFGTESPVGRSLEVLSNEGFARSPGSNGRVAIMIVGVVPDARYEDMRLPIPATAYVPFRLLDSRSGRGSRATFLVRTKSPDPMPLARVLRQRIQAARPEIAVSNIVTQEELVQAQMTRERLLATLALFFAAVALILAAVGLYGVLNYAIVERRRELGICLALGATAGAIARRVVVSPVVMIALGAALGVTAGLDSEHYITSLLYQVKGTGAGMLAWPLVTIFGAALVASLGPVLRAVRIDPAALLRAE